jgi:hypothetical protein
MDHMHSAQPRLSAVSSCVEEYVEKLVFLAELMQLTKVMDAACAQVRISLAVCWPRCSLQVLVNTSR